MSKVTIEECKNQITQILSELEWEKISETKSESDVPETTLRDFQSGIFKARVYTDDKDEKFVSIKFSLKHVCKNCTCSDEKKENENE